MAFRQPKSLRDHLVRARLKPDPIDDKLKGPIERSAAVAAATTTTAAAAADDDDDVSQ